MCVYVHNSFAYIYKYMYTHICLFVYIYIYIYMYMTLKRDPGDGGAARGVCRGGHRHQGRGAARAAAEER